MTIKIYPNLISPRILVQQTTSLLNTLELKIGDNITANILKLLKDSLAEVVINNIKIVAKLEGEFRTGETILLKVMQLGPPLILSTSQGRHIEYHHIEHPVSAVIRSFLSRKGEFSGRLIELLELLKDVPSGDKKFFKYINNLTKEINKIISINGNEIEGEDIKNSISNIGLLTEQHLKEIVKQQGNKIDTQVNIRFIQNNLKTLLLSVIEYIERQGINSKDTYYNFDNINKLIGKMKELVKDIEFYQVINALNNSDGIFYIPLAIALSESLLINNKIIIKDDRDKVAPGEKKEFSFSIFLESKNMGDIRIDGFSSKSSYNIKIFVADVDVKDFIQRKIGLLAEALREGHNKNIIVECMVEKREFIKTKDVELELVRNKLRAVDIKI